MAEKKHPTFKEQGNKGLSRQNTHWQRVIVRSCEHEWQPLSFVFESQLLDERGRVQIRQPDQNNARVYCVCMKCHAYTYITTAWVGYTLGGPDELEADDITSSIHESDNDSSES